MTIDIIPKSLYPVVPNAPGVPALLRSGAQILDTITLGAFGISDALSSVIGNDANKWGVFDSGGNSIGEYDSMFAMNYRNESRISDYPVESGSFAIYNKVDNPFDVLVTLNCGGDETRRASFLASVEAARASLDLYTVTTPEYTFKNVNFVGIDYQRSVRDGAYMISAQLMGREVREISASYSSPKNPESSGMLNQGMIQTVDDPGIDVSGVA
jgi:hypothetical protein